MKNYINTILLGCLFFSLNMSAAYRAADITYRWLNGYTYQIKYTTYTTNFSPDNYCEIDSICFGDGSNGALIRSNGPSIDCAVPAHDGVAVSATVKMNEYVVIHTYPGPGNYTICFNQPNRNVGITNIPSSINQPMSLECFLAISSFGGPNTNPIFSNIPVAFGCMNSGCFSYDPQAAGDIDGDSLSFELAPCLVSGFIYPNAGTGGTLSINPVTGLLSWCNPQVAGDYNVVIRIKEWRNDGSGNYSLVGIVNRDTQFTIESCTGINDMTGKNQDITVYPNPVSDYLEIKFGDAFDEPCTIELTDITGKTVTCLWKDSAIKPSMTFSTKELSSGIYFVKVSSKNKTLIKKLVKQ